MHTHLMNSCFSVQAHVQGAEISARLLSDLMQFDFCQMNHDYDLVLIEIAIARQKMVNITCFLMSIVRHEVE